MIVAFDPGPSTGIATYDDGEHRAWILGEYEAALWAHRQIADGTFRRVVCEGIVITAATAKKSQDVLRSVELIGVLRYMCRLYGIYFKIQLPNDRKFTTDAKLNALGWWTPGADHAREASRHLVVDLCEEDPDFALELSRKLQ